jgi:hypothetical protein
MHVFAAFAERFQSEKEAAYQSTQEARTQLRLVQDERRALMKELQPLHTDRKGYMVRHHKS